MPVMLAFLRIIRHPSVPVRFRDHAQDPRGVLGMTFSSPFLSVKRVYELLVGKGKQRGLIHNHLLPHTLFIPPSWSYHNRSVAVRAPSTIAASFAQVMSGSTVSKPAKVAKPQSVPAMICSRPTTEA